MLRIYLKRNSLFKKKYYDEFIDINKFIKSFIFFIGIIWVAFWYNLIANNNVKVTKYFWGAHIVVFMISLIASGDTVLKKKGIRKKK